MAIARLYIALALSIVISLAGWSLNRGAAGAAVQDAMLKDAAARIAASPNNIGEWQLVGETPLSAPVIATLECAGHINRQYIHKGTGEQVSLTLLAGPAGPMVAHSPEICFSSTEYDVVESAHPVGVRRRDRAEDRLLEVLFRSRSVRSELVQVYYGWHRSDGVWQAPDHARLSLGGAPGLYKLQVAAVVHESAAESDGETDTDAGDSSTERDQAANTCLRFLDDLLPVLDQVLFERHTSSRS